jgi:hypothetical protein
MEVDAVNVDKVGPTTDGHEGRYPSPNRRAGVENEHDKPGPPPEVPPAAVALNVGETALRQVLASRSSGDPDPAATAIELLRSVEALLRSTAPSGTPATELGTAASRLVERQGLLGRLASGGTGQMPPASGTVEWADGPSAAGSPSVDTRL